MNDYPPKSGDRQDSPQSNFETIDRLIERITQDVIGDAQTISTLQQLEFHRRLTPILVKRLRIAEQRLENGGYSRFRALTEREAEVLDLIGLGLTDPQIADRLYVSLATVKKHTRYILAKLNVTNRVQAAALAADRTAAQRSSGEVG